MHLVPAAIEIDCDQAPEAHLWKEEPSAEQYHSPSSVQAPDMPPPVAVPLDAGLAEEAAGGAAPVAAGMGETTAVDVTAGVPPDAEAAPLANTPGEPAAEEAGEAGAEATGVPEDSVELPDPLPLDAASVPVQPTGGPNFPSELC